MAGSVRERRRGSRRAVPSDSSNKSNNLYDRFRKTPKDLFMKIKVEQSKSISMHMIQGLALLLIIMGISLLYYVNYEIDTDELKRDIDLDEIISDASRTSSDSTPVRGGDKYAPGGTIVIEREFEDD